MMTKNALTMMNAALQVPPTTQAATIAELQALVELLTERMDYLELQLALEPARGPMTLWRYLKRRMAE
jgi:hypothetical protein